MLGSDPDVKCLIDTSVLVNIQDIHGDSAAIWAAVVQQILSGRLKTVRQVMGELQTRFPTIHQRLKPHEEDFIIPDAEMYTAGVVAEVRIIHRDHPKLYRFMGGANPADPLLIAVAKEIGAIVVTDERTAGPKHKERIPWVCRQRNVGSMDGTTYLRSIGCNV
jgi:hypothetical protein